MNEKIKLQKNCAAQQKKTAGFRPLLLALTALFLWLPGCTLIKVEKVPEGVPLDVPFDVKPSPIKLSRFRNRIPRGSEVAASSPHFLLCDSPYGYIGQREMLRLMDSREVREYFYQELEGLGYDVVDSFSRAYDPEEEEARTHFQVTGDIIDLKMSLCRKRTDGFFFVRDGENGEASIEIEWTIYDRIRRYTVFKTRSKGYAKLKRPNVEGAGLLIDMTIASAIYNLGTNRDFHSLIFFGQEPENRGLSKVPVRDTDWVEPLYVADQPLRKTALTPDALEQIQQVTVQVGSGAGHGSGFFIDKRGYIVTNAHVTGDAHKIRIVTHKKKHKLVGTVLRRDKRRDVALIKLDEIPDDLEIVTLPFRQEIPTVGENVYAIGSPQYERLLQDTITKGIVSAYRYKQFGDNLNYIQSDAAVRVGNSGGPLLDGNGNIIAICVASYSGEGSESLNLFIPIAEGLEKLDIRPE